MPQSYTIATDTLTEEEILEDFKRLIVANTDGKVTEFPEGSFHTALLEAQAYTHRQVLRYLQYAPVFIITNYLQNVLGLPKREGSGSVTAQLVFTNPTPSPIRLYEGLGFRSPNTEANLILSADLLIPAGTTQIQLQLTPGDGVVQIGSNLVTSNILPPATIVVTDVAGGAVPELEGWADYADRLTNFIASTPQYTPTSLVSLLKVAGIKATGTSQPSLGGVDICVLPEDVSSATALVSSLTQRFNRVSVVASKPITIYPNTSGGKFSASELARFNTAGQVARCDQIQGRSVYVSTTPCVPNVERTTRYVPGDLVKISTTEFKTVTVGGDVVVDPISASEAGYGTLVRFDQFRQGDYSAGAGYTDQGRYYIVQTEGYQSAPRSVDEVSTWMPPAPGVITSGVVISGDWGLVVSQPVTWGQQPTLVPGVAPYQPTTGQAVSAGDVLILFGKYYRADSAIASFNYSNPLTGLTEIFFHDQLISRPIYTRYGIGVWRGQYWNGQKIVNQPAQGRDEPIPINQYIRQAGNSYGLCVQPLLNEIECDVPLILPPCTYFVSP